MSVLRWLPVSDLGGWQEGDCEGEERREESDDISFQEHYDCPGQEDPAEATSCCSPGCCSSSTISHSNLSIVISLAIIDFTLALVLIVCCCCQKCPLYENINFSSVMRKPRFPSRIKYSKTETRILKYWIIEMVSVGVEFLIFWLLVFVIAKASSDSPRILRLP